MAGVPEIKSRDSFLKTLNARHDQVLCGCSCLPFALKASSQLFGEYLDIRLAEYSCMIPGNLVGFGVTSE